MKHLFKLIELTAAVILSAILFPIALIYNLIMLKKGSIFPTLWYVSSEIILIIFDMFEIIAVWIDRLGNLILGNMFIDRFITDNNRYLTHFGEASVTISAAFGFSLRHHQLNKKGINFAAFLDKIFGEDHCKNAYLWFLIKRDFNNNNTTGIS